MEITIKQLKEVARLSKKSKLNLRQMNFNLDRAYVGMSLTKYQLIYQIVFLRDAPDN